MRNPLTFLLLFAGLVAHSQKEPEVQQQMKRFHEWMVKDKVQAGQYVDDSLSYGHSNGWIENKKEFLSNLGDRIVYHSITEDSVRVSVNGNVAHARFVGMFDVTLEGKQYQFRLRVLEVWVKKGKRWLLFARQAIRG